MSINKRCQIDDQNSKYVITQTMCMYSFVTADQNFVIKVSTKIKKCHHCLQIPNSQCPMSLKSSSTPTCQFVAEMMKDQKTCLTNSEYSSSFAVLANRNPIVASKVFAKRITAVSRIAWVSPFTATLIQLCSVFPKYAVVSPCSFM